MGTLQRYAREGMGWVGALFSLLAFSLNSLGAVGSQSAEYLGMQIAGCLLMALYAACKRAHASWVLNAVFLLVALIALVRAHMLGQ